MPWVEQQVLPQPTPGQLTKGVQTSLAPWADPAGNWQALNAALASMLEPVAQIVLDRGQPDGPLIGTLAQPLSTSSAIVTIQTTPLLQAVPAGSLVMTVAAGGTPWQLWTVSNDAGLGAQSVAVTAQTPNYAYPAGAFLELGYAAGWSTLLDPDMAPTWALPFLGQCVGVSVPPNTPDGLARQIIKAESGMQRGTPQSIITAAKSQLTGTQSVSLLERTPGPYAFVVVVRPEEVVSLTALTNAIAAVKPAGLTFQIVQTDGWTIFQMESQYASISALEAAFTTINGLEQDQLGH